ncbi:MAG: chromosomal replication initiator protein [Thermoleophilaceae bacterium]|nr:chromosomal replication initiator protein [Thermoleophilaceae bacterium]
MPEDLPPQPQGELASVWDAVQRELRTEVTEVTFHIWLQPLEPAALLGGTLYVRAPDHIRTWVQERFRPLLATAARRVGTAVRGVEIVAAEWEAPTVGAPTGGHLPPAPQASTGLNPRYTFEQFVICDGNRLGHAAALAVAEMPAQAYNPLFIHGKPGLGKTHLLHAIGNYLLAYGDSLKVRYATVEEFTAAFVSAMRNKDNRAFRERFREADVLLIDDILFLAEKMKTEEEFFHTFNALYEAGAQLVIASDRKPRDIGVFEARLLERFEHGLVAELEPPDFEARMAILRKRARVDSLDEVADDTLAEVARYVNASVRSLEGALIRVVAYASLRGERATPGLARQVLERLYPRSEDDRACTLAQIQEAAADIFGVSHERLLARDRTPRVSFARQVAMYVARELTDETLPAIGRSFGGRNHTTVLHAYRRIAADMTRDQDTLDAVDALRVRLGGRSDDRL